MTTTQSATADVSLLADHLASCRAMLGPAFRLRCIAESVHARVLPRFVTTVCVSCLVLYSAAVIAS